MKQIYLAVCEARETMFWSTPGSSKQVAADWSALTACVQTPFHGYLSAAACPKHQSVIYRPDKTVLADWAQNTKLLTYFLSSTARIWPYWLTGRKTQSYWVTSSLPCTNPSDNYVTVVVEVNCPSLAYLPIRIRQIKRATTATTTTAVFIRQVTLTPLPKKSAHV